MRQFRAYLTRLGRNNIERAARLEAMTGTPISPTTVKRLMRGDLPRQIRQICAPEVLMALALDCVATIEDSKKGQN